MDMHLFFLPPPFDIIVWTGNISPFFHRLSLFRPYLVVSKKVVIRMPIRTASLGWSHINNAAIRVIITACLLSFVMCM